MKYWPERTGEPVQVAALEVERHDARRLVDDPRDPQPVAHRGRDRLADAERQHERGGRDVQRDPVDRRELVVDEVRAR